jgi:hypothetical protein
MVGLATDGDGQTLAAARLARAVEVGRAFAEIIRDEPFVRELWVTADTEEPGIYLWLITDPIDMDAERDLHGTPTDRLFDRFPREDIWVHPLNPRNHIGDIHGALRRDAVQIPLRAG